MISCSRVTPLAARDFGRGLEASGAPRSPRAYAVTRDRHPRSRGPAFDEERIFFGSQLKGHFVLDTVFVVRERYPYAPARWREASLPALPATFVEATLGPLSMGICDAERSAPSDTELTLYVGATPEDPVDGMFSFVPAMRARPDANAFARPNLCESTQGQGIARTDLGWSDAVRAVERAGLLLATSFAEPSESLVAGTSSGR